MPKHSHLLILARSRLKRARKKFSDTRVELLREHRLLQQATVGASEDSAENIPPPANVLVAGSTRPRHGNTRRSVASQQRATEQEADSDGEEIDIDIDQGNILRHVDSTQVPDDDVVVDVEGKTFNQRQLALWYQATDMHEDRRKLFEAKNVEINQIRMVRRRN